MSRLVQSSSNFYSTLSNNRPGTVDPKAYRTRIVSTGESFLPSQTMGNFRPQTSSFLGRSSSSSFRNTKGRLEILG